MTLIPVAGEKDPPELEGKEASVRAVTYWALAFWSKCKLCSNLSSDAPARCTSMELISMFSYKSRK